MGNYTVTVINANFHARIKLGNLTMVNQVVTSYPTNILPKHPTQVQCSFAAWVNNLPLIFLQVNMHRSMEYVSTHKLHPK